MGGKAPNDRHIAAEGDAVPDEQRSQVGHEGQGQHDQQERGRVKPAQGKVHPHEALLYGLKFGQIVNRGRVPRQGHLGGRPEDRKIRADGSAHPVGKPMPQETRQEDQVTANQDIQGQNEAGVNGEAFH